MPGLLAKDRIIAPAGYNRWLVPPAAVGGNPAVMITGKPDLQAVWIAPP